MRKIIILFVLLYLGCFATQTRAFGNEDEFVDRAKPGEQVNVLKLAESIGLKSDFENLYVSGSDETGKELAQARALHRLWQTEFELKRILLEIDEERTALTLAIEQTENRQILIANSLDSANFLSTSIIALVGNCIFIPAPPPRPKVPNILFSTANGISTGMSLMSLAAIQGGRASVNSRKESMLAPLFAAQFNPEYSGRVWDFLNYHDENSEQTIHQRLLDSWKAARFTATDSESKPQQEIMSIYGLGAEAGQTKLKLSRLKTRRKMLEDLQYELLRMSRTLSDLGHCL